MQINGKHRFYLIKIKGLVQGVGFRPFVYRLAMEHQLNGWVENRNDGVWVKIEAVFPDAEVFRNALMEGAPVASSIKSVTMEEDKEEPFKGFEIRKSESHSNSITDISPDIAVCDDCLFDSTYQPHRFLYPFINCTNCGPRFTIIRQLPYDRAQTTMQTFDMCQRCGSEYKNLTDRRFHAQPIACNSCGPTYTLHVNGNSITDLNLIFKEFENGLQNGKIYAVKGLGGFHLMCNALDDNAVKRLRELKKRDGKPFAVMFSSLSSAKDFVKLNKREEKVLQSWRRPIVLCRKRKELACGIADELSTLGIMLPYMPFHHFLFDKIPVKSIVLTSGNISGEPVMISNEKAKEVFEGKTDGLLDYNREIYNRADDSVVMVNSPGIQILRRSRGYVPNAIQTLFSAEGIFAAGAELVNSFCMGKGNQAIFSQYIGDLKNLETYQFYTETFQRFSLLFRFKPEVVVCDFHPDYLSSRFSQELAQNQSLPLVKVQHHHAHIASVMGSCGIDEPVIGFAFDGTGLGTDGHIWGGEVMVADLQHFERRYYFEYIPLPGGDKAVEEPWRIGIAYLYQSFGEDFLSLPLPMLKNLDTFKINTLLHMINNKMNSPLYSSCGRLFDGVASILGILQQSVYHAEAPMKLESIADISVNHSYNFEITENKISFKETIRQIVNELIMNVPLSRISGKFHHTLSDIIRQVSIELKNETGIKKVVFSGGSFQNRLLVEKTGKMLKKEGMEVFFPDNIPVNDQGIALGQLMVAAKKREFGLI